LCWWCVHIPEPTGCSGRCCRSRRFLCCRRRGCCSYSCGYGGGRGRGPRNLLWLWRWCRRCDYSAGTFATTPHTAAAAAALRCGESRTWWRCASCSSPAGSCRRLARRLLHSKQLLASFFFRFLNLQERQRFYFRLDGPGGFAAFALLDLHCLIDHNGCRSRSRRGSTAAPRAARAARSARSTRRCNLGFSTVDHGCQLLLARYELFPLPLFLCLDFDEG